MLKPVVVRHCKICRNTVLFLPNKLCIQTRLSINTLKENILKTAAYFDLFDYPLTAEQLFQFLPQNSVTVTDVQFAADALTAQKRLGKNGRYYFLPARDKKIIDQRIDNERRAASKLIFAKIVSGFIKQFPFTRAVFITGSLSKNVAPPSSDIDFMIVTAPDRLWICKSMLTLFRKVFLLGSYKFFCTNFYIAENNLALPTRSFYDAIELMTIKVCWNESAFNSLHSQNMWTKKILPNMPVFIDSSLLLSPKRSLLQQALETILNLFPLAHFDEYLMKYHINYWGKKYPHFNSDRFAESYRTTHAMSTVWGQDHRKKIEEGFQQRLAALQLEQKHG